MRARSEPGAPRPLGAVALPWLAAAVAVTAAGIAPRPAAAAEEELVLALEPGWALTSAADARHGASADLSAWLGVTEVLWLSASAGAHHLPADPSQSLWELYAGLVAALDVLRTIPFFEAQLGVTADGGTLAPGIRVGLGADYLISPTVSVGAVVRWRTLADELGADGLLTAQVRLALRIEL
ncbi:hypothetical protein L6R52_20310 [Myxococcota bacterium]|nr:hypothetical protein [Myxococcota bacterium]